MLRSNNHWQIELHTFHATCVIKCFVRRLKKAGKIVYRGSGWPVQSAKKGGRSWILFFHRGKRGWKTLLREWMIERARRPQNLTLPKPPHCVCVCVTELDARCLTKCLWAGIYTWKGLDLDLGVLQCTAFKRHFVVCARINTEVPPNTDSQ